MLIRSHEGILHAVEGDVTITGEHDQQAIEGSFVFAHQGGERVTPAGLHLVYQVEFPPLRVRQSHILSVVPHWYNVVRRAMSQRELPIVLQLLWSVARSPEK